MEELCTLKKEIDNHSQLTAQAVAHTRQTDNEERPTTQARRPLEEEKVKGSVFSEIDNHSQLTAQAVAHTRQTDNEERPTTQARRPLEEEKVKGSVFSESLIPGKRRASFQQECKGNTIDSIRLEKHLPCHLEKEKEKWLPQDEGFNLSVGWTECVIP
ncbi:UNVERIFIED_CONTAM: hypothetical protein FKN15_029491 [Acipenser sinensis]